MLQGKARWTVGQAEECEAQAQVLEKELNVSPLLSRLLAVRGFTDVGLAAEFLHGGTDQAHDPFLLDGMEQAVARIRRAIETDEKIRIYGDYDADGVSSTSLMVSLLGQLGCRFDYYIPHRVQEGYGLHIGAIDAAKEQGVSLIVTVDTGISAVEQIAYASSLGIDVVVTDHHEPPEQLPEACALVNPKKPNCPYPFKHLAGVGVAFKLAHALLGRWPDELLEYVAIGTIADLMHLSGENRVMVKRGIERMRGTTNAGIRALLEVAGVAVKEVNSTHIGFALAPRINASGRLLSADAAVKLLTTDNEQEANQLADSLDALNKERQRIVDDMTREAAGMAEQLKDDKGDPPHVLVLAQEDWNVGVIGIVASKMVERYYRPTIVLGIDKETGMAKGSARSIPGFDLYQALTHCHGLLDHFGGHQMAAGMTVERGSLPELAKQLNELARQWLGPEDLIPKIEADLICAAEELTLENIQQLEQLGPFGMGNPVPRIMLTGLNLGEMRTIGKERNHLKLTLTDQGASIEAIGFGKGALSEWISPSAKVDVLGELSVNEWNGIRRPQLLIQDLRIGEVQLFDWRGATKPERRVAELLDKCKRKPPGEAGSKTPPAIVVFGRIPPPALRPFAAETAIWTMDIHLDIHPHTEQARSSALSEAEDIIVFNVPDKLEQIEALSELARSVRRYYAVFGETENDRQAGIMPGRDMFKSVYGAVAMLEKTGEDAAGAGFCQTVANRTGLSPSLVSFMLEVFAELGIAARTPGGGYKLVPAAAKRELSTSSLYQARMRRPEVEQTLLYSSAKELLERFA
ncbi:single-stranded-DNA-specific exonuclease [Paenibacillus sp. UNCCL117]|uniref:single-stranded-DNA-specific exonuclease RecJ n=1 Tax=unclassified Paenibacillus TaxID=185978 RepID=UPI00087E6C36|nr:MULTISPECIES: single-stranded-DNA-specific exonuclease RecJ [unclassified Paenibacillus]SDE60325.1 single-stranded-DNA-specific exonuclease [Paenibacillus sp. cl123]SFW69506.1 single-stranded-DNA-specific exonuclease [Paenibacillus sp. UNCCL117]